MSGTCTCTHTPEVDAGVVLHASYCLDATAHLTPEQLADYAALDFTDLMPADAAVVVARMRDALVGEIQQLQARVAELQANQPTLCGRTQDISGNEYPPCELRVGHWQAYCRGRGGRTYFLSTAANQPVDKEAGR